MMIKPKVNTQSDNMEDALSPFIMIHVVVNTKLGVCAYILSLSESRVITMTSANV